jgi:hypothetical protein
MAVQRTESGRVHAATVPVQRTESMRAHTASAAAIVAVQRSESLRRDESDRKLNRQRMMIVRTVVVTTILMLSLLNCCTYRMKPKFAFAPARVVRQVNNETAASATDRIVDILSIGSLTKVNLQDAQQRTFGSHPTVRNFYRITEADDADQECPTTLTSQQLDDIIGFCKKGKKGESFMQYKFRRFLFNPTKHPGWMCAQKRPIDGLNKVLNMYKEGLEIPEYVFVIDDDTYINMESVVELLTRKFPAHNPSVVTGCRFEFLPSFAFPYGGFGSMLTKTAIERLLKPITCNADQPSDPFSRLACWNIQSNVLGEQEYFRDGMSVSELMFRFASAQRFGEYANWKSGYCLHSDHTLAYFMTFYHIAVPDHELTPSLEPGDWVRKKYQYQALTDETSKGQRGECLHLRESCTTHHHVCHYIQPEQMDALYLDQKLRQIVDTSNDMRQVLETLETAHSAR